MAEIPPVIVQRKQRAPTLYAIIGLKFIKAAALLMAALGAYFLVGSDLQAEFSTFLRANNLDTETKMFPDRRQWLLTIHRQVFGWWQPAPCFTDSFPWSRVSGLYFDFHGQAGSQSVNLLFLFQLRRTKYFANSHGFW